jgi:hypothetical protein
LMYSSWVISIQSAISAINLAYGPTAGAGPEERWGCIISWSV